MTIGRHEPVARLAERSHLVYGMDVTLEEARLLLARARVEVSCGRSPARAKVEQRSEVADALTFGRWAARYFEFKSDDKSGAERLADSTLALRRSIYGRILEGPFAKLNLDEIKPVALGELLDRVKRDRGPGPAVHARELVLQVYRFAAGKGVEVDNSAEALRRVGLLQAPSVRRTFNKSTTCAASRSRQACCSGVIPDRTFVSSTQIMPTASPGSIIKGAPA